MERAVPCLMSQNEFIKELTSADDYKHQECISSRRERCDALSDSELEKRSKSTSKKQQHSKAEMESEFLDNGDEEEYESFPKGLSSTVVLTKACMDKLKSFLCTALAFEQLNYKQFLGLSSPLKQLVEVFLRSCLGFEVPCEAPKLGEVGLVSQMWETMEHEQKRARSYAFLFECYFYGLKKQLRKRFAEQLCNEQIYHILFDSLFPHEFASVKGSKLEKFVLTITSLLQSAATLRIGEIECVLSSKLIGKMKEIKVSTLKSYFLLRLSRYLREVLSNPKASFSSVYYNFNHPQIHIELFTNLSTCF